MNFIKLRYKNRRFSKNPSPHSYEQKWQVFRRLVPIYRESDGPAIWGGCVTRRKHRAGSRYFSRDLSRWQARYGVLFAVWGVCFIIKRSDRGISCLGGGAIYPGIRIWQTASGAVSRYKLSRSQNLSWYKKSFIACR
jgi:hypothetical protein